MRGPVVRVDRWIGAIPHDVAAVPGIVTQHIIHLPCSELAQDGRLCVRHILGTDECQEGRGGGISQRAPLVQPGQTPVGQGPRPSGPEVHVLVDLVGMLRVVADPRQQQSSTHRDVVPRVGPVGAVLRLGDVGLGDGQIAGFPGGPVQPGRTPRDLVLGAGVRGVEAVRGGVPGTARVVLSELLSLSGCRQQLGGVRRLIGEDHRTGGQRCRRTRDHLCTGGRRRAG